MRMAAIEGGITLGSLKAVENTGNAPPAIGGEGKRKMGRIGRMSMKEEAQGYLSGGQVAKVLGLNNAQLVRRIKAGLLPAPPKLRDDGMRLFTKEWLHEAQKRQDVKLSSES